MQKNFYLEFVRGTASILVFITHLFGLFPKIQSPLANILCNWGTESVMVFFILSGIVINISQTRNMKPCSAFLYNRFIRLYPQYIVSFFISFIIFVFQSGDVPDLFRILGNLLMVSTLQGFLVSPLPTNPVIWSLSFEVFFYIIFSLTLLRTQTRGMFYWLVSSCIAIPFYFLPSQFGWLSHLIAMFAFSGIWMVGYFIFKFRSKMSFSILTSILSLGLLPLTSRLQLTNQYYDPLKFLLFAIVSIPFFHFCIKDINQHTQKKNKDIFFSSLMYFILAVLLLVNSKSLLINKIIYIVLPLFLLLMYYIMKKNGKINYLKCQINKIGLVTGKYSYAIYIIHYPILFLISKLTQSTILYIMISTSSVILSAWVLESKIQPMAYKLMNK